MPPVKGEQIFKKPKSTKNSLLKTMTDKQNRTVGDLWNNCKVVYLKTNFRQGDGNPWTELLNRVRIGDPTDDDIRQLNSQSHTLLSKDEYDLATHVFYRNMDVYDHNTYMMNILSVDQSEIPAKCEVPRGTRNVPHVNE